ncbi:hypothetical protein LCGC14_1699280 [marine sediment metagenome]|uniref:Helicase ATP-binding domain-containing protein n=1 Tax=marine sediment metagenome TaxID=412755 RepID=A0A0F9KII4_9ZZZZ
MFLVTTELWDHQKKLIKIAHYALEKYGYCWWIAGCAIGKTLSSYKLMEELRVNRVLVITTKAAITSAWLEDAKIHTEGFNVVAPHKKSVKGKIEALRSSEGPVVYVINYESAWRMWEHLAAFGFELVICDESHKLKGRNSNMSKLLCRLNIPRKLIMTGTPWDDRPTDAFGQIRFCSPIIRGNYYGSKLVGSWTAFFEEYVIYHQTADNIKIPLSYKNLDKLRQQISDWTVWIDSEDVLDLPPEVHIDRFVTMLPKTRRVYRELKAEFIAQINDDTIVADNILVQALRLHQITSGFYQPVGSTEVKDLADDTKLKECLAILDEIGGKPVVIFTVFQEDVKKLLSYIPDAKLLIGGRHEHNEWQAGEGQVLIANLAAGSTGVNLSRARYCIYYSVGHSKTNYNQSTYRVRRPGSDLNYPITYYHIQMEGSIDTTIRRALDRKGDMAKLLLEGLDKITR